MKRRWVSVCLLWIVAAALLASCGGAAKPTVIQMELTKDYDSADPFVDERLFVVTEDVKSLQADVSIQMEGQSGVLEIAENETKQVLWSHVWNKNVKGGTCTASLDKLDKNKEYVARFTGTGLKYAKIRLEFQSGLVRERERPQKPK